MSVMSKAGHGHGPTVLYFLFSVFGQIKGSDPP